MEAFMTTKGADFISRQQYAVSVTVAVLRAATPIHTSRRSVGVTGVSVCDRIEIFGMNLG